MDRSSLAPTSARRLELIWASAMLVLAAWFYFWTATSAGSPLTFERPANDLYNRLADGFLAGQTSFLEPPPPELAKLPDPYDPAQNAPYKKFHDVTYFRGKYFLYFGPTPALTLLVPWKLLTGSSLPQNLAVVVFAWGAAALSVGLMRELRDRFFPATRSWLVGLLTPALVFGTLLPLLLRRPLYYELAIASACFFGLAALWLLLRALGAKDNGIAALAGAGLCLGLAVGSRPNYLFGAVGVLATCLYAWWRVEAPAEPAARLRRLVRRGAALLVPFGGCIVALLVYNYARFGSITEFGTSYTLSGSNQSALAQTSLRFLPINLYYYLLAAPQLSVYFPFIQVIHFAPFAQPEGYGGQENTYGIAVALPVLWTLAFLWPVLRRGAPAQPWQVWARGAAMLAIANAGFLMVLMGAANRYMVDFVPPLMVLAAVGWMHADASLTGARRWLLRAAWPAALIFTLVFNVFVSLQHNELLSFHNHGTYAKLAHAFNRVSVWLGKNRTEKTGPLRVRLVLPRGRSGQLEPLLVTGLSFRADFVYLFYTDDRHLQVGFEHTSYGGPVTKPPLEIDYGAEHTFELELGSLWPPVEHPFYDGWATEEIARRKRTLRVKLDGREVLAATCDFYDSSPGDVSVGRNPVSDAFGRKFTGKVLSVERMNP